MTLRLRPGRFSRAAVFAGLAGCSSASMPAPSDPPPRLPVPVPADAAVASAEPPPAPPVDAGVADAPPDAPPDAAPQRTGRIVGRIVAHDGSPATWVPLTLGRHETVHPDGRGVFTFENVPVGEHEIEFRPSSNPRHGSDFITVVVKANQTARPKIRLPKPVPTPCCMPYGAPPARARIV